MKVKMQKILLREEEEKKMKIFFPLFHDINNWQIDWQVNNAIE